MAFQTGIVDALDPLRLRLLVEVQRRGSISAAAEACRVSQPSATKHLKTVEAALGEKLVERNGRASALTDAGRIVAAHAARALDTLDGMSEELDALRGAERGRLALAASTTPGTYVLPSILQCFADRHPRVEVEVMIGSSTWVAERVARREVSLALAGEVDWPDGVRPEPFLEDEVVGISAPGQLRLRRGKASVSCRASRSRRSWSGGSWSPFVSMERGRCGAPSTCFCPTIAIPRPPSALSSRRSATAVRSASRAARSIPAHVRPAARSSRPRRGRPPRPRPPSRRSRRGSRS